MLRMFLYGLIKYAMHESVIQKNQKRKTWKKHKTLAATPFDTLINQRQENDPFCFLLFNMKWETPHELHGYLSLAAILYISFIAPCKALQYVYRWGGVFSHAKFFHNAVLGSEISFCTATQTLKYITWLGQKGRSNHLITVLPRDDAPISLSVFCINGHIHISITNISENEIKKKIILISVYAIF